MALWEWSSVILISNCSEFEGSFTHIISFWINLDSELKKLIRRFHMIRTILVKSCKNICRVHLFWKCPVLFFNFELIILKLGNKCLGLSQDRMETTNGKKRAVKYPFLWDAVGLIIIRNIVWSLQKDIIGSRNPRFRSQFHLSNFF